MSLLTNLLFNAIEATPVGGTIEIGIRKADAGSIVVGVTETRILGELKKHGVHSIGRSTGINILREAGLEPGPKRGVGTRSEFLERHAETLWASDFPIDNNTKYAREYDAIVAAEDTKIVRIGPRAPNLNAYAERFPRTLRQARRAAARADRERSLGEGTPHPEVPVGSGSLPEAGESGDFTEPRALSVRSLSTVARRAED